LALIAIFLGTGLLPFQVNEYFKPGIFPILFLFGPLLHLYLSSLTIENFRWKPVFLFHLVPFIVVCVHRSIVGVIPFNSPSDQSGNPSYIYNKIYYSVFILTLFFYWVLSMKLVLRHKKNIPNNFSNYTPKNTLNWSIFVLSLFLVFFVVDFSLFYLNNVLKINVPTLSLLSFNLTLFTFIVIFFGINQNAIYPAREVDFIEDPVVKEAVSANKNDRKVLDDRQIKELSETIFQYLKSRKPYLNPDFSLQMMVDDLNISREKLSYFINNNQGKNFYKFINEFRVEEVREKLLDASLNHYTVLGIGLECGFNSKASFNRIFKEETGLTPSEYKKHYSS
jgi:AraC-like DNA-binding protein